AALLTELGDRMHQARNLAASGILVNDTLLRRPAQYRLGFPHGSQRCLPVAGCNRLFHLAHRGAHARAAGLVNEGAAGDLARRLLSRLCIRHWVAILAAIVGPCPSGPVRKNSGGKPRRQRLAYSWASRHRQRRLW